jgi:hypothetical protein
LAVRLYGERFPQEVDAFRQSQQTATAFFDLARTMERRWIDWLTTITARHGRIFASESVQMCFIEPGEGPDAANQWSTVGTLRMTRTTNLADYFDGRFQVQQADRWNWVIDPPQKPGQRGRLFDVQGLILSLRFANG